MFPITVSFPNVVLPSGINRNHTQPSFYIANRPALKPFCSRWFVPKIYFSGRKGVWTRYIMKESTKVLVFQNGDKGVSVLGEETFLGVSSQVRSYFNADDFERNLNRQSKWVVSAPFAAVTLWRQDAEAYWAVTGTVINVILCATLKRLLKQERPVSGLKSDPGMPSSHAQSIFFAVVFVIFSITQAQGINEYTIIASGLTIAVGSYLSLLRVSQQFHTVSQVVVGGSLGSIFSMLWFWSWDIFVRKAFFSSLVVRFIVTMGAAVYHVSFLVYIARHWLRDE